MITINNIYDLLHILFDVLGSDFTAEVTSGAFLDDTIKVTKHDMYQQHMQILGVCGYFDWWECDWCGYATEEQEHIFTAKESK